jgi:hypothetical protein
LARIARRLDGAGPYPRLRAQLRALWTEADRVAESRNRAAEATIIVAVDAVDGAHGTLS